MSSKLKYHNQAGFVSILTVLMFMILTSIVTVSFARIMIQEQQQTLNDDLAKGAYDAAQAGIEDAKRAIRYCQTAGCDNAGALYQQSCPGFFGSSQITSALGISRVNNAVQVGDASAGQKYTCTTVSNEVVKYWGELDPAAAAAQATFLPLRAAAFDRVKISWTLKSESGNVSVPSAGQVQTTNPAYTNSGGNSWNSSWPAVMRAMLVSHPRGSYSGSGVTSKSSFFVPATSGSNFESYNSMLGRNLVRCNASATGSAENDNDYVCHTTISGLSPSSREWYLQLAPQYQPTNFKVELYNGGSRVPMRDVGYIIDSTGTVADVYRRVQVMVGPDDVISPSAAIQTGKQLCKNFWVTGFHSSPGVLFSEDCTP